MSVFVVGLSHKTAPIELREKLAIDDHGLESAFRFFRNEKAVQELVLISTCNRVEVYLCAEKQKEALETAKKFLCGLDKKSSAVIRKALYTFEGEEAVKHLLRVVSSLDSMVVGESQILGQVKAFYQKSHEAGTVSKVMHGLFHRAFSAAKEVRTQTDIGRHAASVPSVSVKLAEQVFGDLTGRKALLLGAGDMAELCAEYLKSVGVEELIVVNRTMAKAKQLAKRFSGRAEGFTGLEKVLNEVDIVICSTAAKDFVLDRAKISKTESERKGKPQLLIDISVPRNINPDVDELKFVYLYNVDNLQQIAEKARLNRVTAAKEAERLLAGRRKKIMDWLAASKIAPAIKALTEKFDEVRKLEIERTKAELKHLKAEDLEKVEYMSRLLVKKLLHEPLKKLKKSQQGKSSRNVDALKDLFDLKNGENE